MYEQLKEHVTKTGSAYVPQINPENRKLGWWVTTQRRNRRRKRLTATQIEQLDSLNFDWEPMNGCAGESEDDSDFFKLSDEHVFQKRWLKRFEELSEYRAKYGNCRVPLGWSENRQLGSWVGVQRGRYKMGLLSQNRIKKLESIGFEWVLNLGTARERKSDESIDFESQWANRLAELAAYKEEFGNCRVPSAWSRNAQLANWVGVQRRRYKHGKLSPERTKSLEALEFDWVVESHINSYIGGNSVDSIQQRWDFMFEKLQAYKSEYGDCLVSQGWKPDTRLADWVTSQRTAMNRGQLSVECIGHLNNLGFDWDPIATRWDEMFQQLLKFKEQQGHTNVPQGRPEWKELGTWVRNQRKAMVQNQPIMKERSKRLDEIGFVWRVVETDAWDSMFASLAEYRQEHGHCNVPQKSGGNQKLGKWVNTMRWHFKQGKLSAERVRQLEELGFVWNTRAK